MSRSSAVSLAIAGGLLLLATTVTAQSMTEGAVDIGTRVEMFVDRWLVERMDDVSLHLVEPERREIVWKIEKPWEGPASAYFTALKDGDQVRLYYRASVPGSDRADSQLTCVAESGDGIHFSRPYLGLFEFEGSKDNNIVFRGQVSHNFAPFVDTNPAVPAAERYKAIGSVAGNPQMPGRLYPFSSPDGINWRPMGDKPLDIAGAFDSLNVAFWDPHAGLYRCYSRVFLDGYRSIQSCSSTDFVHWTRPVPNAYPEGVPEMQLYTNATTVCPGAEHILLSFPMRFYPDRTKIPDQGPGVSDAIFMASRDGVHWSREFLEGWVRPGRDDRNWTHRNNMPAWGIVQTSPDEFSMYISEHYVWPDGRVRRLTIGRHRFASVRAGFGGGQFVTRPLTFAGDDLILNYSTSAGGSVRVEVLDEAGEPVPGFTLKDAPELFGDEFDAVYRWAGEAKLGTIPGRPVKLRFHLKDADLYAIRTGNASG